MAEWGKCLGYIGEPCPNCNRIRVERYENGKDRCEKCGWCPQDKRYVDSDEIYPIEENAESIGLAMVKKMIKAYEDSQRSDT